MIRGRWSFERLYQDSDAFFRDLLKAITEAKYSVILETYIFEPGVLADRVVAALIAASGRGVKVLVLVDGFGSPYFRDTYGPDLEHAGIRFKVYKSWPWVYRRFNGEARYWLWRFAHRLSSFHRRNHRKVVIIDQTQAWIGSHNISDCHLKEVSGENHWVDTGVVVGGLELEVLHRGVARVFSASRNVSNLRGELVLLNDGWRNKLRANAKILRLFRLSKERIWIQTPYFVPIRKVVVGLIQAKERGVDVRIIIPRKNDVQIVKWMSLVVVRILIEKGVRVYEYCPRFAHQKILQVDSHAFIGSTNLNHRSFIHDLEVQVAITHESNKRELRQKFEKELAESVELAPDDLVFKSWGQWFLSRLFFLLRYWS